MAGDAPCSSNALSQLDMEVLTTAIQYCCKNEEGLKIDYKKLAERLPRFSSEKVANNAWLRVWRKLQEGGGFTDNVDGSGSPIANHKTKGGNKRSRNKAVNTESDAADDEEERPPKKKSKKATSGRKAAKTVKDEVKAEESEGTVEGEEAGVAKNEMNGEGEDIHEEKIVQEEDAV